MNLKPSRMPVTSNLAWQWYDTPNIHLCTLRDFTDLCATLGIEIVLALALDSEGRATRSWAFANLFSEQAVFLLRRQKNKKPFVESMVRAAGFKNVFGLPLCFPGDACVFIRPQSRLCSNL